MVLSGFHQIWRLALVCTDITAKVQYSERYLMAWPRSVTASQLSPRPPSKDVG
jgi:hypothetical protein